MSHEGLAYVIELTEVHKDSGYEEYYKTPYANASLIVYYISLSHKSYSIIDTSKESLICERLRVGVNSSCDMRQGL